MKKRFPQLIPIIIWLIILCAAAIMGEFLKTLFSGYDKRVLVTWAVGIISIFILISLVLNHIMNRGRLTRYIKTKYPQLSIIGIIRLRKNKETLRNIVMLLLAVFGYLMSSKYFKLPLNYELIYISFLAILLLGIENLILGYRISKGFYGNNEREAREIIQFILKESENIDFTDNGKLKKIISDADLEELEGIVRPSLKPQYE